MVMHGEASRKKYPESHVYSGALAPNSSARARSVPRSRSTNAHTAWEVGLMATIQVNICRFCGNTVLPTLSVALFTKASLERDLPGRISRVVDLPVSIEDGLSPHLCRPCMRKFQTADTFRSRVATRSRATINHPLLLECMALERG